MAKKRDAKDLVWARDVLSVYEFLDFEFMPTDATPSQRMLHRFARERAPGHDGGAYLHRADFLKTMVPKAQGMLADADKEQDNDGMRKKERRSMSDLYRLLGEAVAESASVQVDPAEATAESPTTIDPYS